MAHPLTQHPPPSLPFLTAPRPSPLAFGFGLPSSPAPLSFGTPPRPSFPSSSSSSFGFGAHASPSPSLGGPSGSPRKPLLRPAISSPNFRSSGTGTASLKRTRRSPSPTPSTSPSPSSPILPSPSISNANPPRKVQDDAFSVGDLALKDRGEPRRRKEIKRSRKEVGEGKADQTSDVDVGVLLAALPPSSHLSILMNVLSANPHLAAGVLKDLPKPDHNECLAQLGKHVDNVKRAVGYSGVQLNANRLWTRVEKDVQAFTKTASTYLSFFTSPTDTASSDPQSIQHLLQGISNHIIYILRLVPSGSDTNLPVTQSLLQLGKRVIGAWTKWLDAISAEVNQRNGMFPHSMVEGWMYNLDTLAKQVTQMENSGWSYSQPSGGSNILVDSFRDAMRPIRDRFVVELGWLIGRQAGQHNSDFRVQNEDEDL